jgi:hypothetical protein
MDNEEIRPVHANQATMWTLSTDRKLVRLAVPPLPIVGFPKPLNVSVDFDAKTVDAMLERHRPAEPDAAAPAGTGQKELDRDAQPVSGDISLCIPYLALQFLLVPDGPAYCAEIE